jgi:Leucine-rich repeat (LRR) protein
MHHSNLAPTLVEVCLARNRIGELPAALATLGALTVLDVSHNPLRSLRPLPALRGTHDILGPTESSLAPPPPLDFAGHSSPSPSPSHCLQVTTTATATTIIIAGTCTCTICTHDMHARYASMTCTYARPAGLRELGVSAVVSRSEMGRSLAAEMAASLPPQGCAQSLVSFSAAMNTLPAVPGPLRDGAHWACLETLDLSNNQIPVRSSAMPSTVRPLRWDRELTAGCVRRWARRSPSRRGLQ